MKMQWKNDYWWTKYCLLSWKLMVKLLDFQGLAILTVKVLCQNYSLKYSFSEIKGFQQAKPDQDWEPWTELLLKPKEAVLLNIKLPVS